LWFELFPLHNNVEREYHMSNTQPTTETDLLMKLKSLTLVFIFITISITSCSGERDESKVEIKENLKVKRSLENHVLPIIDSFDLVQLRKMGFSSPYNLETKTFDEKIKVRVISSQKKKKINEDLGYMWGMVTLQGSSKQRLGKWMMKWVSLSFTKLSHNEPWKLITYGGYVEDMNSESVRNVSPEIHSYIKSKFDTIENIDWINSDSLKKIIETNRNNKTR
jgi:hypothetical protein